MASYNVKLSQKTNPDWADIECDVDSEDELILESSELKTEPVFVSLNETRSKSLTKEFTAPTHAP